MIDWKNWLLRWDKQQERYIPNREERFEVMFDIVESQVGVKFIALDLGCGPGSLSLRLMKRFPNSKVYSIDIDPMLLKIANNAIGEKGGRISWIEADLRSDKWFDHVDHREVDVALSSTALHWLPPADLVSLYYQLFAVLREDGIFLNAEGISFPRQFTKFNEIIDQVEELRSTRNKGILEGEEWDEFWEALKREFVTNDMQELVKARENRFHWRDHTEHRSPSYELQREVLIDAGFSEVGVIWQNLKNRILLAVK